MRIKQITLTALFAMAAVSVCRNNAAREVLKDYPEILICDLAGYIDSSPEFDNWRKGRDVHFWKAEEQALVGKAVAGSIKKALEVRRRRN